MNFYVSDWDTIDNWWYWCNDSFDIVALKLNNNSDTNVRHHHKLEHRHCIRHCDEKILPTDRKQCRRVVLVSNRRSFLRLDKDFLDKFSLKKSQWIVDQQMFSFDVPQEPRWASSGVRPFLFAFKCNAQTFGYVTPSVPQTGSGFSFGLQWSFG